MFMTAQELENDMVKNLSAMDMETVFQNRDAVTARLHALGMYDLARDFTSFRENAPRDGDRREGRGRNAGAQAELLNRLYAAFGMELYGNVEITGLSEETVEFECLYGLTDPATNAAGREISFTVRDKSGRFPVYLSPENITAAFSLSVPAEDVSCAVKACAHDMTAGSTRVTLLAVVRPEAFFSEGEFIMTVEIRLGGKPAASRSVRFAVKNTFPTFFREDFASKPLPSLKRPAQAVAAPKTVIHTKSVIQTRQKSTRITFDKRRGDGIPTVLCSNSAFKASMATRTSVNVLFKLSLYSTLSRKLMSSGVNMRFPPETSVWAEWDDVVIIYNVQYKGFLMEAGV